MSSAIANVISIIKGIVGFTRNFETVAQAKADKFLRVGQKISIDERDNGVFFVKALADVVCDEYGLIEGGNVALVLDKNQQFTLKMFGAIADDTTDIYGAFRAALDYDVNGTGTYPSGASLFVGGADDKFFCSETIELKHKVKIFGDDSGLPSGAMCTIRWPENKRGIIVHRYNTIGDGVQSPTTTGADGSIITGFKMQSDGGTDTASHGFWMRARCEFSRMLVDGFAGNNCNVVATSGSGIPTNEGNANNFIAHSLRLTNAGLSGWFVDGADVNAAECRSIDATKNGAHGIYDSSFLGNTYTACHVSQNGTKGRVSDGVNRYYAKTNLVNSTVAPSLDSENWGLIGVGGTGSSNTYPLWISGNDYLEGRSYKSDSPNARNVFVGCYSEPGYPPAKIDRPSLILSGSFGSNVGTAAAIRDDRLEQFDSIECHNIKAEQALSGTGTYAEAWNSGGFSTSRGARYAFRSGLADGDNELTGAIFGLPRSSSINARHSVGLEIYDGLTESFEKVFTCRGDDNRWRWGVDDQWELGAASFRAKEIFATNGTINTSDEREKTPIGSNFSAAEKAIALELKASIGKFKWLKSVDEKGDNARIHIGVGAQTVKAIFESHGLDGFDYGLLCYNEWEEETDEDDNVTLVAGNRYGVRLDQINAFILANM